ncbi:MAG TPA: head GIN domain-containing protein [Bacteroidales bacterium]|nr:head GIN domain-containing protein [Bacteroidales bacterium]
MKRANLSSLLMLGAILMAVSTLSAGCNYLDGVTGNGNVIKQERNTGAFTAIDVSSAFKVYLTQGTANKVTVEADENLMQYIRTRVEGNKLIVECEKPIYHSHARNIYITFVDLNSIDISGAVYLETQGKIAGEELEMESSGASEAEMTLAYGKVKLDCSGASKLKLSGSSQDVSVDFSGASELKAYDYVVDNMDVDISGAGEANVNVVKTLRAEISGAGEVRYKGSPVVDQHISGAGSIKKVD